MSDTDIARDVRRLLAPALEDIDTVRVEVEQGVVYLEGVAVDSVQKQRIGQLPYQVAGVRRVVNCLSLEHVAHLSPPPQEPRGWSRLFPCGPERTLPDDANN